MRSEPPPDSALPHQLHDVQIRWATSGSPFPPRNQELQNSTTSFPKQELFGNQNSVPDSLNVNYDFDLAAFQLPQDPQTPTPKRPRVASNMMKPEESTLPNTQMPVSVGIALPPQSALEPIPVNADARYSDWFGVFEDDDDAEGDAAGEAEDFGLTAE
jgi:hypothetical protein